MSVKGYTTKKGKRYAVSYTKPDGTRTMKRGFRTQSAARAWEATTVSDILTGEWIDQSKGNVTLGALGDVWIKNQTHLKPSSLHPIKNAYKLRVKPTFGDRAIGTIKHTEVKSWLAGLRTADGTRELAATGKRYALQVIRNILDDAVRDGLIPSNPCDGIPLPKKTRKKQMFLTAQELHDFAALCGEYELMVLVLGYTGIRFGEAIALRGTDVNVVNRRINIDKNAVWLGGDVHEGTTKTDESRTVPIPRFLVKRLQEAAEEAGEGLLWTAYDGTYVRRPLVGKGWFFNARRDAGLPEEFTLHDLRHTAASLAVQSGANVKAIQKMLGHASAAMTLDIYASLFDDDLDDVAERMDERAKALGLA